MAGVARWPPGLRPLGLRGGLRLRLTPGAFDDGGFEEFDESRFSRALSSSTRAVSLLMVAVKLAVKFAIASACADDIYAIVCVSFASSSVTVCSRAYKQA